MSDQREAREAAREIVKDAYPAGLPHDINRLEDMFILGAEWQADQAQGEVEPKFYFDPKESTPWDCSFIDADSINAADNRKHFTIPLYTQQPSAQDQGAEPKQRITLNALQLREAAYWANPDLTEDEDETEVCIEWMPKRTSTDGEEMEAGDYLYYAELPEEGVIGPLGKYPVPDAVKLEPQPAKPAAPDGCFDIMRQLATALNAAVQAEKVSESDVVRTGAHDIEIGPLLDQADAMLAAAPQPGEGRDNES